MLTRPRTAVETRVYARARSAGQATRAQRILAPLCIVAAGAAFAAEVIVGTDATTFGALAVVPVLAASMLRSRPLILIVAAFSMLLQVWGVAAGVVSRDEAGMQISVYLLVLVVTALHQARSPIAALHHHRNVEAELRRPLALPAPVIQVTGVEVPQPAVAAAVEPAPAPAPEAGDRVLPINVVGRLTRRERDVVQLAVQGLTAREIGTLLFIGDRTVETHLANAYGKLGVRSKVELVRLVAVVGTDHTDLRTRTEAPSRLSA